jgi:hypothetical protein
MADKPWKVFERYVAEIFCTTRNALSGGNSKVTRSDSLHPEIFVSCKYTQANNKRLRDLVTEERQKAKVEHKTAVCVIGEFDDRQNSLVVIHLKDIHAFCEAVRNGSVQTNMVADSTRTVGKRAGTLAR